jgi:hypothetical protein
MVAFMAVELKDGWIQELGRTELETVPSMGRLIKIAMEGEEARSYEVLEIDPATDATSVGGIVLMLATGTQNVTFRLKLLEDPCPPIAAIRKGIAAARIQSQVSKLRRTNEYSHRSCLSVDPVTGSTTICPVSRVPSPTWDGNRSLPPTEVFQASLNLSWPTSWSMNASHCSVSPACSG